MAIQLLTYYYILYLNKYIIRLVYYHIGVVELFLNTLSIHSQLQKGEKIYPKPHEKRRLALPPASLPAILFPKCVCKVQAAYNLFMHG